MKTSGMLLRDVVATLALFFISTVGLANSLTRQASEPARLPTTQEILDRYVKAIGGEDALRKVTSITTESKIEIPSAKLHITSTSYSKLFKQLDKTVVPGDGEYTSGYDGKTAWSVEPKARARIIQGKMLESIRRDADIYYPLHEADYFSVYKTEGVEQFAGHDCYHIKGTTKWGKENNQFYDVKSGLLIGYRFASDSTDDPVMNVVLFENYKSFGGPLVPTRITAKHGDTVHRIITITSVSYSALDDSIFDLPEPVKSLVARPKSF